MLGTCLWSYAESERTRRNAGERNADRICGRSDRTAETSPKLTRAAATRPAPQITSRNNPGMGDYRGCNFLTPVAGVQRSETALYSPAYR
jgi:hypothetical protein